MFYYTLLYCFSQILHFFYKLKARTSTSKKIMTLFVARLAVLLWSGTEPAPSPRCACTNSIESLRSLDGIKSIQHIARHTEDPRSTLTCFPLFNHSQCFLLCSLQNSLAAVLRLSHFTDAVLFPLMLCSASAPKRPINSRCREKSP